MGERTETDDPDGSEQENGPDPWAGIRGNRPDSVELALKGVLGPAKPSGSQAFPASASDTGRWYVKAPNNPQGGQILVTEYVVSRVGDLIGAPVCTVRPITIGEEFEGFQVENGPMLHVGIASASQEIRDAVETKGVLPHRGTDDNARRHAGVFALCDWCWGDDPQWLTVETDEHRLYSHDHGFYFPPGGAQWSKDSLTQNASVPHPLGLPTDGLDAGELDRLADALDGIPAADIAPILASVPAPWPVTDEDLEALGRYLATRAPEVAERLRAIRATLGVI